MPRPSSGHGPEVHLPPPLLYAVPFAALSLLERVRPLPLPGGAVTRGLGAGLLAGGLGLAATGAGAFRRRGTTVIPHHQVHAFVTDGPYGFTRNPMYLGLAAAYTGGALARRSAWPVLGLPLVVTAVQKLVIDREEHYLRERFGSAYTSYCTRVRRWL